MFCLSDNDSSAVKVIIKTGKSARIINRAHALNMRNKNVTVIEVADFLELTPRTVINITSNYNEGGLQKKMPKRNLTSIRHERPYWSEH
jgi:predicted transcriptional regulator of viral defense system